MPPSHHIYEALRTTRTPVETIPFMIKPMTLIGTNRAKNVGKHQATPRKAAIGNIISTK
jgi:hypothetical protein